MSNNKLEELLNLPIPESQTKESLKIYLDQLNMFEPGTDEFAKIEKIFINLGYEIPPNYLGVVITNWYEKLVIATKEAERPKSPSQTTPTDTDMIMKEMWEREISEREARKDAKKAVEEWQKRKQAIYEERQKIKSQVETNEKLKEQINEEPENEIHIKIDETKSQVELTPEQIERINILKQAVIDNPKEATEQLAQEIKSRIINSTPPEMVDAVANQTALYTVTSLTGNPEISPIIQHAVAVKLAQNPEILNKVVTNPKIKPLITDVIHSLSTGSQLEAYHKLAQESLASAFGKNVQEVILPDLENFSVNVSATPEVGYTQPMPFVNLMNYHSDNLQQQDALLDDLQGIATDTVKSKASTQFNRMLARRIENLPQGHILRSDLIQNSMRIFGIGTPINWATAEGAHPLIQFAVKSGYGPVLGTIQTATGWNLGISKIAGSVTTGVAKEAGKEVVKKGASGLLAKFTATIINPLNAIPVVGPVLSWIATEIVFKLLGKLWDSIKNWWTKNKDNIKPFLAIGAGAAILPFFGPVAALAGAGGMFLGLGGSAAFLGFGVKRFFKALGNAFVFAVATPVIVTILIIPPLVAFIMLVINTGAYLVPPDPKSMRLNIDNPYMLVTKVASPDTIDNPTSGKVEVTYTVTITALKSTLTNLKITDTPCTVSKKNASTEQDCPEGLEKIDPLPDGLTVTPSSPYTFTFTSEVDSSYADSSIFDSIKISADTEEKKDITTSGSESVCIGDCPHGCFVVSGNNEAWPSSNGSNMEGAAQELASRFPNFVEKVCAGQATINLCYTTKDPSPVGTGGTCIGSYYARHMHSDDCDVNFNQCGTSSSTDSLFLLTHEMTHHIQENDGGGQALSDYESSPAWDEVQSGGFCSYPDTQGNSYEAMAEANGLLTAIPAWGSCVGDYKKSYPANYNYANGFMSQP